MAVYTDLHLERLTRIRELQQQGFSLSQIQRVLDRPADGPEEEPLLAALIEETVGERTLSREAFAAESGMPEVMILAAERAGLFEPVVVDGEPRFVEADLGMARAGLMLLEAGIPLQELLELSSRHAQNVQAACDAAIDLFDDSIRKRGADADDESTARIFREMLPQVTRLVALHFQRTLVARALERFRDKQEHGALAEALAATESAQLDVEVTWR
ncbi:MAG: MerR family transcriptional regulator [Deltaproteobacteria bacterium]|nr:MerR family transcriptional regulator [Deltaproteobacteria bacterium]